jgi:hypothetical protein
MLRALVLGCGLVFALSASSSVRSDTVGPIHWAYSAYFGTGAYSIDTGESVYVLSLRPGWWLRHPALGENGERTIGLQFRLPVTMGVHQLDSHHLGSTLNLDNVGTLSVVPGIEIDIPMTTRWSLKPVAYAGRGSEVDGDASAWIYWAGVRSRLSFHERSFDWALVNALSDVGYSNDAGRRESVLPLLTGLEFERPIAKTLGGEQVHLHWHVAYTNYLDGITWAPVIRDLEPIAIEDEWEIGAAFSRGHEAIRLWRLHLDRVGIAYRFSSNGHFEGVSLVFGSLYDR